MPVCNICHQNKDQDEFGKDKRRYGVTYRSTCKLCKRAKTKFKVSVANVKKNLRRQLALAPYRTLTKVFMADPSLWNLVAERVGLLELEQQVRTEKVKIIGEARKASHFPPEIFEAAVAEIMPEVMPRKVKKAG